MFTLGDSTSGAAGFLELLIGSAPRREVFKNDFYATLPGTSDERFRQLCAVYRALSEAERCDAQAQIPEANRGRLISWPNRLAMIAVRQRAREWLDDAVLGLYLSPPGTACEPDENLLWMGELAVCLRGAQLLGLGAEVLEGQLPYACEQDALDRVRRFLAYPTKAQRLQDWGFVEETGDHGIIFRWRYQPRPSEW